VTVVSVLVIIDAIRAASTAGSLYTRTTSVCASPPLIGRFRLRKGDGDTIRWGVIIILTSPINRARTYLPLREILDSLDINTTVAYPLGWL
jgi:hypothetical protein